MASPELDWEEGKIHVYREYWKKRSRSQQLAMFHEFSHLYGQTEDYGYAGPLSHAYAWYHGTGFGPTYQRATWWGGVEEVALDTEQEISNADSYAGHLNEFLP